MATLSGKHREDGAPVENAVVSCYDYTGRLIANLTTKVATVNTDVNGDWSLTVAAGLYLVRFRSASTKKTLYRLLTAD